MPLVKTKKADLISQYKKALEISYILALVIIISAFKFFPKIELKKIFEDEKPVLITAVDITPTRQIQNIPPPPKPSILIEASIEEEIEEFSFVDINENREVIGDRPPEDLHRKIIEDEPFILFSEEMPEPIGGIQAIQSKIVYPEIAKRAGVEGKVYVLAFVDENGDVRDAKIIKGIGAGCDEAALEAVKKTKFKPGKQRGKPVRVQVSIPVVFKLQ
ncbi:MAG: energy transducer TonB [Ignavibacterium album]|uniref:energy transducer TonB n=1 Tax=Ignavibacterium album TaxID=591197 RepID=UPI0026F2C16E|nr:energy transducer TonB [Ignavibacterium album]MBI5663066.1 energy transducer TonB [Ignavibacterium album]